MKAIIYLVVAAGLVLLSCTKKQSNSAYEVLKTETVDPISSEVVQMVHKASGAQVVLIKNDDPARSFMVGFRTPPYDDTGLFHIFEHAVLEGSRLYPSKSNFFHLANSSVASFINAMTGSVYTLYPFVTRSPEDFDNLMSVYMDAVFFPNVLEDPRIIRREGWRYEVNPETSKMSINGIVLSEMKGAFSSPYRSLWFQLSRSMVPDTPFTYSSGGLPEKIATLTFEQIKEAHKKYYHPQNSVIYLYGDLDYDKALATIDENFLSKFKKTEDYQQPAIPTQKNFDYPTPLVESTYPGQSAPDKDFVAKGYILGEDLSIVEESAASVLGQAFIENTAAPLKLRMLKEGLAKSTFNTGFGGEENGVAFVFEGTNASDQKKIETVLNEELDKIIKEGIDQELLTSILNKYEFSYKEKNANGSHRGMQLGSIVLNNWIYKDEPLKDALDFVTHFKKLRLLLSDQQFVKDFFKKHFKENTKSRWVVLKPDPDFSKKFNAGLDKQVEDALKEKSLKDYQTEIDAYEKWVAMKEPAEIIGKTPTLQLDQIKADEAPISVIKTKAGNTEVFQYPQDTAGIAYLDLFFDLSGVSEENLKKLEFLTSFIKRTDTQNYGFKELSKEIDTYIGGISLGVANYQSAKNPEVFKPTLKLSMSFINENREKAIALAKELMTAAEFGPEPRLSNLIDELKTGMVSGISYRAPGLSMSAATRSFFPELGAFNDLTSGGIFENYVLNSKLEPKALVGDLKTMLTNIFNQQRLYLAAVTSSDSDLETITGDIKALQSALPEKGSADQKWAFSNQPNYDGYAIPGEVQYVSQVTSFSKKGLEYNGSMDVYSRYLNNNYMTPKLREQAGAYGGRASFSQSGLFSMSTYKDPNLKKSFEIFSEAINFMKNEKFTADTLRPAILGSLKPYYQDKSVYGKTSFMTSLYLTDQSWDDYMRMKKEILATTPEQMAKISEVLSQALKESQKGVAGNAEKLKAEANFLKNVLSIQ